MPITLFDGRGVIIEKSKKIQISNQNKITFIKKQDNQIVSEARKNFAKTKKQAEKEQDLRIYNPFQHM